VPQAAVKSHAIAHPAKQIHHVTAMTVRPTTMMTMDKFSVIINPTRMDSDDTPESISIFI